VIPELITIGLILVLGWRRVGKDRRVSADWLNELGPAVTGAASGAAIATAHSFKRDIILTSLLRFISGVFFGTFGTPKAIAYIGWEPTTSNTVFVASVIGLGAFIFVQAILAEGTRKMAQKGAQAVIGKVAGAKQNES
jgi:hypothetical protein